MGDGEAIPYPQGETVQSGATVALIVGKTARKVAAEEAFPKWANLPMKERARLMRRLGDLIDQNVPEIAAMETADTGL
ncbi:aldehyde dehydrogenase family protein, partial [Klebsiella pneumoniae]|uniref:aldehyde dehydrogenase family protein n=1 Tax=Klebsiella pneumoniae TaxID=573 RepID=UPI00238141AD